MYKSGTALMDKWLKDVQIVTLANDFDQELSDFHNIQIPFSTDNFHSTFALKRYSGGFDPATDIELFKDSNYKVIENGKDDLVQEHSCVNFSERKTSDGLEIDPLSNLLNDYYENQVQDGLDRKNTCEDIAYSVAYKVLRKVQTVDDRFRASSLVPHGIPYDGLKGDESIYFEMMVQLCAGDRNAVFMKRERESPFVKLQLMSNDEWDDCTTAGGFLSPSKVQHTLRRYTKQAVHVLRKYISQGKRDKIPEKLYSLYLEEGPTVTLTINENIRVRILPALSVPDNRLDLTRQDCPSSSHVISVPKVSSQPGIFPFVDGSPSHVTREDGYEIVWKLSFFVAEKNKMRTLGSGCRIQLLRTLTEIRDNSIDLKPLSSYHLKTILLHECDKIRDPEDWEIDKLSQRFMGLLQRLKEYLLLGICPHYFMSPPEYPKLNLFEGLNEITLGKMASAIEKIINSPSTVLQAVLETKRS